MSTPTSMAGYAPEVIVTNNRPSEREIYRQMWAYPQYRAVAPGEHVAQTFLEVARPKPGAAVLDMGCGTGRGSLMLAALGGMNVTMLDFADNCLDEDIKPMLETQSHAMRFVEADLTQALPVNAEYGFCTDVLEHIPPEQVDAVLDNALLAAQHVFFQISTVDDVCGRLIGHALHLSVHPYDWWLRKFRERDCLVHWSQDAGDACMFYVSAWVDAERIVEVGALNIDETKVRANVAINVARGYVQAAPHWGVDTEVMILGGGPSLDAHVEEIRKLRADGVKLVALNGAHDWCLDNGITPSAMVMVDARTHNVRFTRRPVLADPARDYPGCRYMLASQCDPAAFEGIPHEQVLLWHTTAETIRAELDAQYGEEGVWWGVPGGSTVLLRAIPLLCMLGFARFHLFGCDSCLQGDAHHAYAQAENDEALVIPVTVGGRVFRCHAWMASQAQEFIDLIKFLGTQFELSIYGDGLLHHILTAGAEQAASELELSLQHKG